MEDFESFQLSLLNFNIVEMRKAQLIMHFGIAEEQAGAELGQAQLKLGLDLTLIFCRFGFNVYCQAQFQLAIEVSIELR